VIRDALALTAANVCFLIAGAGLTRPLGLWRSWPDFAGAVGIAYVAGVAAVGVLATLMLVAGLALTAWQILVVCAPLASCGLLPRSLPPALGPRLAVPRAARSFLLLLGALLAVYLVALGARSALEPLRHWDAWAMWTFKARAIVLLDGLDLRVFAGSAYSAIHRDYPLFVPALEAIDFRFMGRIDTRIIDLQFWLLFVGFLVATAQLLRDRVQALLLWPALFALALAPSLAIQLRWSIADFPLALMFALAALCGWRYLESRSGGFLALLSLFSAAAWSTKREGVAFVVVLYVVLAAFALVRRERLGGLALAGLGSLAALVPWAAWVKVHHVEPRELPLGKSIDPGYLFARTERLPPAAKQLAWETVRPSWWLALFPLLALAVALVLWRGRSKAPAAFVLALLPLMYASLLWAYWADVPEIHKHVAHTGPRVVTTILVVCGVFLPLLAAELARAQPPPVTTTA
jgi:hypothetical protein